ncbi:hypothetical protein F5Y13DRAFT_194251 [Hypoxylon sp. FL1857]|nr:hypothetical protein F5Y13DRAFT_194251 [Hypoxylon sp. FL1857]
MFIEAGLRDRTIWPPKCHHKPITTDDVAWTQSEDLLEKYREANYARSLKNPLWCAQPQCSSLLEEDFMGNGRHAVICDKCETITCKKCKKAHNPKETKCRDSDSDVALEKLAKHKQWRRCSRCTAMVERADGCSRMMCLCGHFFCYFCGSTFGTCQCLEADDKDDRLKFERHLQEQHRLTRLEEELQKQVHKRLQQITLSVSPPQSERLEQFFPRHHAHPPPSPPSPPSSPWPHVESPYRQNSPPIYNPFLD